MNQKVNIGMVEADSIGTVVSTTDGLSVQTPDLDNSTLNGSFDQNSGQLTLNIPTIGTLVVTGLPTIHSVGYGQSGMRGKDGRDGINGLMGTDGSRGSDGCAGARGIAGIPGPQGPEGRRGSRGATGNTGATGATGENGRVDVFVQSKDPREDNPSLQAGCIWVKTE